MITAFQVFGLTPRATDVEVRTAYRTKLKKLHPDACGDEAVPLFLEARRAFGILSHPDLRRTLGSIAMFSDRLQFAPHEIHAQTIQVLNNFSVISEGEKL